MRLLVTLLCLLSSLSFAKAPDLPKSFDSLGPTVQSVAKGDRTLHYIDDGEGRPVLFLAGLGTSVRAIRLLDFLESFRTDLGLRFISVERNGLGQTVFDPQLTIVDYVSDAEFVLDYLGVDTFAVFAISGGGIYAGHLVPAMGHRVTSIHMAVTAPNVSNPDRCLANDAARGYSAVVAKPMEYFYLSDQALRDVGGLQDTAFDEAARAANMRGQQGDATAVLHEIERFCAEPVASSEAVNAPLFVYLGAEDSITNAGPVDAWMQTFPNSSGTLRIYADEGHTVQYRHLDQILLDLAGLGDKVVVCKDGESKLIQHQGDIQPTDAGLCAWYD